VNEIGARIAQFNAANDDDDDRIFFLADTCQSIGHLDIDVQMMQCSGLVATGRKYLRGPRGTGFLHIPETISQLLWPHHIDHYGAPVSTVPNANDIHTPLEQNNVLSFAPRYGARRFEFWESNIAGRLGLGQALEETLTLGQSNITSTIMERTNYLVDKLRQLEGVKLHHTPECGIVTFWVSTIESSRLAAKLQSPVPLSSSSLQDDVVAFEVSVVPATSTPLDSAVTGVPDLLRTSVSYTTTNREIDLLCEILAQILIESK